MGNSYLGVSLPVAILISLLFYALPAYFIIKGLMAINSGQFNEVIPKGLWMGFKNYHYTGAKAKKAGINYILIGLALAVVVFLFLSQIH